MVLHKDIETSIVLIKFCIHCIFVVYSIEPNHVVTALELVAVSEAMGNSRGV